MKRLNLLLICFAILTAHSAKSQDTLPNFSLKNVGNNRIIIGWTNNFENIRQISIQRSFDSLTGYKTILTVADPTTPQNGYVDTKAVNDHMFYRVYVMLDRGIFMFSPAKRPVRDTSMRIGMTFPSKIQGIDSLTGGPTVTVTKLKPAGFIPSLYVFTHRDGYVKVSLPTDEKPKKYTIKFFDSDDNFLFELKEVKEREFKLDKTNFYHAGWFKFELYEDDKLLEKHKFYIDKDF